MSTALVPRVELRRAGLRYSTDEEPGIRRRRAGRSWAYRFDDGSLLTAPDRARCSSLTIPPAWSAVWVCGDDRGHIQATGRDARRRKQYRYHEAWRSLRDETKYSDLAGFADGLTELRHTIESDLALPGLPRRKVVALAMALLDRTLIRVGNESYRRDNGSFGLTTLYRRHVTVERSTVAFSFAGKSGVRQSVRLDDRRLAAVVRRCHELGGRELFSFCDQDGSFRVDSSTCNDYLRAVLGDSTSVKVFRTWGGTVAVVEHLCNRPTGGGGGGGDPILDAIDAAARRLGNTRAVARRAYVHPGVLEAYGDGRLQATWRSSRRTPSMSRPERTLRALLTG